MFKLFTNLYTNGNGFLTTLFRSFDFALDLKITFKDALVDSVDVNILVKAVSDLWPSYKITNSEHFNLDDYYLFSQRKIIAQPLSFLHTTANDNLQI